MLWLSQLFIFTLCLLSIGEVAALEASSEEIIPDYKALASQLDFHDPEVSAFEMRRILTLAFGHSAPSYVMNDSVRDFEPGEAEKYLTVKDGRYLMQIYGNGEGSLRKKELQKLQAFRRWLKETNRDLPKGFNQNLEELRVMACRGFDFKESYDSIWAHDMDMRERVFPILRDFASYHRYFQKGFYYALGRDQGMHPIVVLNARKWLDSGVPLETLLEMIDIMSSYMIEVGTIPGRVETWHTIIDLRDLSLWEMPIKAATKIAMHFKKTVFVRGASVHFTNVPKMAEIALQFVYNFLDDFQKAKLVFWSDNYRSKFEQLLGLANLEKKFYGKLPNKKADFWPPTLNTTDTMSLKGDQAMPQPEAVTESESEAKMVMESGDPEKKGTEDL